MEPARYHRLAKSYLRLVGHRCRDCDQPAFPARRRCPACRGRSLEPFAFSGLGTVFAFATLHVAPSGFEAPYVAAIIELAEGPRVTAQLADVEGEVVVVGQEVTMVTRRLGRPDPEALLTYGYKFRPRLNSGASE